MATTAYDTLGFITVTIRLCKVNKGVRQLARLAQPRAQYLLLNANLLFSTYYVDEKYATITKQLCFFVKKNIPGKKTKG